MVLRSIALSGGHAKRLPRQTALAEKATFRQDGNHRFFALRGYSRELHLATLDVEHSIRGVSLREDGFIKSVFPTGLSSSEFGQKVRIESGSL